MSGYYGAGIGFSLLISAFAFLEASVMDDYAISFDSFELRGAGLAAVPIVGGAAIGGYVKSKSENKSPV